MILFLVKVDIFLIFSQSIRKLMKYTITMVKTDYRILVVQFIKLITLITLPLVTYFTHVQNVKYKVMAIHFLCNSGIM